MWSAVNALRHSKPYKAIRLKTQSLALSMLLASTAMIPAAEAQTLVPGSYSLALPQSTDNAGLAISSAPMSQIPASPPYGDQGYTVNAWGNCNCIGNPALDNSDTLRITAVNPGTGPAQVNGLSVYMLGNASNDPGIGQTTGMHVVGVDNNSGPMWGYNAVLADSPFLEGYTGAGRYLDNEWDFNIASPNTTMTGLSIGGILLNSPSYGAGFTTNFIGSGKITEFAYSWDGCCDVALHAGLFAKPQTPNAGSQYIKMDWTDQFNNKNYLTFAAFENTMVLGTSDQASKPAYAVSGAAGIYTTVNVSKTCQLIVSGGLITGKSGNC